MNHNKKLKLEGENQIFVLIPQKDFEEFTEIQKQILNHLHGNTSNLPGIGDFIPKEEAERILGRKETTLWKLRKEGKIKSSKVGNEVFYSKSSILEYLTKNLK